MMLNTLMKGVRETFWCHPTGRTTPDSLIPQKKCFGEQRDHSSPVERFCPIKATPQLCQRLTKSSVLLPNLRAWPPLHLWTIRGLLGLDSSNPLYYPHVLRSPPWSLGHVNVEAVRLSHEDDFVTCKLTKDVLPQYVLLSRSNKLCGRGYTLTIAFLFNTSSQDDCGWPTQAYSSHRL